MFAIDPEASRSEPATLAARPSSLGPAEARLRRRLASGLRLGGSGRARRLANAASARPPCTPGAAGSSPRPASIAGPSATARSSGGLSAAGRGGETLLRPGPARSGDHPAGRARPTSQTGPIAKARP